MFSPVDPKQSFPDLEEKIIKWWKDHKIFEKSVKRDAPKGDYVFYDGPPFATGTPHYGHILAGTLKDVVPRYFTMKGYRVERRWGWDCHGLPMENIIEKELELKDKKAIEKFGIANFNEACRSAVLRYADEWGVVVERMARWVDFENSYKTMDTSYMETIWWVFRKLWDKKLIYKGYKSMHICPRCSTPLSNFEVGLGYKDITDISATVRMRLVEDPKVSLLAWTTTPWTLPGNMALAVGKSVDYVQVKLGDEQVILAEAVLENYFPEEKPEIVKRFKGKDLVGKKYQPLYDFYGISQNPKAFQVYIGDFVTTTDGTGIVHIAPGFGEDDLVLSQEIGLPMIQHVGMDGEFKKEVTPFAGKDAKKSDKLVAEELASRGLLFREQKYQHSYPHCWRCETPLLNYATESWFVKVTQLKDKLLKNNKKILWVPDHLKHGRFGKWLEGAKDWAISRNRFWGAPLPVWECDTCKAFECFGSIDDLKSRTDQEITNIIFMRHGESEGNLVSLRQGKAPGTPLTKTGLEQAKKAAATLKKGPKIDLIIASPFQRTLQTAEIVGKTLGVEVITDDDIREINFGKTEGKTDAELQDYIKMRHSMTPEEHYVMKLGETGESHKECEDRMMKFLKGVLKKYPGKNVLIVSHSDPLRFAERFFYDYSLKRIYAAHHLPYATPRPHYFDTKTGKALDLHKHFVDKFTFKCSCKKGTMKRIPEVLDCWFESGAMPYAQSHYPFENKESFEKNFPAQFIAEGLDQTRGWFYTLTVLAVALFDEPAFHNVIVNGIVLAEDGRKMSKRLQNYPDPQVIFDKYGADAMRFYLMNSPVVKADDLRFSERGVEEVVRSVILPLWNSYSFFVTYATIDGWDPARFDSTSAQADRSFKPTNKLDQWILSEMHSVLKQITHEMDIYDLQKATDHLVKFLDNLTNWYIRRSRRRFWKSENDADKTQAYATLYTVLTHTAQMLAPFSPCVTEQIYKNLTGELSVHLSQWPQANAKRIDEKLNKEIELTRLIVTLGHAARSKARIKVRQPLSKLSVVLPDKLSRELLASQIDVISEELNVKSIEFLDNVGNTFQIVARPNARLLGPKFGADVQKIIMAAKEGKIEKLKNGNIKVLDFELLPSEIEIGYLGAEGKNIESDQGIVVILDTVVTDELRLEGIARDIIRQIQDLRKKMSLNVSDRIEIGIVTDNADILKTIRNFGDYIKKETLTNDLSEKPVSTDKEVFEIEGSDIELSLKVAR